MDRSGWMGGALDTLSSALRMPVGAQSGFGTWGLQPEAQPQGFGTWGGLGTGREAALFNPIALFEQQANEQLAKMAPGMSTGAPGTTSAPGVAPTGAQWAGVNQWTGTIEQASAQFGVPGNLIRAVMKLESNGVNLGTNGASAVGPMQVTYSNWGSDAQRLGYDLANPNENILMGAYILQSQYQRCGDWRGAINAYYSGSCQSTGARDNPAQGGSGMPDNQYTDQIWATYQQLDMAGPGAGMSAPGGLQGSGSTTLGWSSIWGGVQAPITFEFDAGGGRDLYGYGSSYGMNGVNHTGVDIGVPRGTTLYSPGSGVVTCAGTGRGSGADGGGCAAFGDSDGGGAGRVEVLLDNGVLIIYGHSASSLLQPGSRVSAGTPVAKSGGMFGAHLHLETRVRDPSTGSGWRIVDPRTVLGGSFSGLGAAAPGAGAPAGFQPVGFGANWWNRPLDQLLGG